MAAMSSFQRKISLNQDVTVTHPVYDAYEMLHIACMEEMRLTYRSLVRKPEWKRHLGEIFVEGGLYESGS
jgi:hypothetical protein